MKILFADKFPEDGLATIAGMGHDCEYQPDLDAEGLTDAVKDAEALIVRSTRVTAETIESSKELALIIRAGAGTNTIDRHAAAERGIYVANVPGKNAIAVAELTMGLLLAIDRNIPANVVELRAGEWNKSQWSKAEGLYGKTMGIIGLGDIGIAVARRARAFGMEVYAVRKPNRDPDMLEEIERLDIRLVTDTRLLARSADVLSIHVPYNEQTENMIGADLLGELRPGAVVINTSRGEVVDEEALIAVMDEKGIRAGLDVFRNEPKGGSGSFLSPLAQHPNVYGTHHIGASTDQSQRAIAAEVRRILEAYTNGQILHPVNLAGEMLGQTTLAVRHFDRVGVLASVFNILREADLNVEQMDNTVFEGAKAAVATLHVVGDVPDDIQARLETIDDVIHVTVRR